MIDAKTTPTAWEPATPENFRRPKAFRLTAGQPPRRDVRPPAPFKHLELVSGPPPVREAPQWTPMRATRTITPRHRQQVAEQPVVLDYTGPEDMTPIYGVPVYSGPRPEPLPRVEPHSFEDEDEAWFTSEPAPTLRPAPQRQQATSSNLPIALALSIAAVAVAALTAVGAIAAAVLT